MSDQQQALSVAYEAEQRINQALGYEGFIQARRPQNTASKNSGMTTSSSKYEDLRVTKFDLLKLMDSNKSAKSLITFLAQKVRNTQDAASVRQVISVYPTFQAYAMKDQEERKRLEELQKVKLAKQLQIRDLKRELQKRQAQLQQEAGTRSVEHD